MKEGSNSSGTSDGRLRLIEWRAKCYSDPVARLRYLRRAERDGAHAAGAPRSRRILWRRLAPVMGLLLLMVPQPTASDVPLVEGFEPLPAETHPADTSVPTVWLVEETGAFELYSNGLRIETGHTVAGVKRPYPVYDRETLEVLEWRSGPIGILYHSSESNLAPFDPGHNSRLQSVGGWLLEYVQDEKAYHYVIDRFGRVHRIVRETDAANHAGYSVWADGPKVYVNLNPSFIGISFEAHTEDTAKGPQVSQAQIHAARVLTEMLRAKYGIGARNCVTHAQVSVAPSIMRLGNHMDWAASFPFGELNLENNYAIPNPAVAVFGFRYDPDFLKATGQELWRGIVLGEDEFRQQASGNGSSVSEYRAATKKRYRQIVDALEEVVDAVERTL